MKIAYLTNQYPKVSHTFIRREIQALEALGCTVERFSVRSTPDKLTDPLDIDEERKTRVLLANGARGIAVAFSKMAVARPLALRRATALAKRISKPTEKSVAFTAAYLAEACLLVQECERLGVNHVHVHFGTNPATVAMLAAEMGGPTFSFTVHGPEEFDKPQLIHLTDKIAKAKFVVAISSFGKSQLYRWCPADEWHKVHIVRCGVDADYLDDAPRALPESNQLVCVGRLCEQKGQLLLVEAIGILRDRGIAARVVLVGDGEMRAVVEARISALKLQQQITITGWANGQEVKSHLLNSIALVLPSFAEGLPVVIMESLALARPVISTFIAGIPELVIPGENGFLVPAGDVEALARAIEQVIKTPTTSLFEMGKRGRAAVSELHSARSNAQRLFELFTQQ